MVRAASQKIATWLDDLIAERLDLVAMKSCRIAILALTVTVTALAQEPRLPGIGTAMQEMMAKNEIAGAVTLVVSTARILHVEATGWADLAAKRPMTPDALFWIASMTRPVTGVAVLMLQDEGKLSVADPIAKYLPEFANLKTPSGKPANLTITQVLTHTSGLGEATGAAAQQARTLADLVPIWLAAPMQYEPGEVRRAFQHAASDALSKGTVSNAAGASAYTGAVTRTPAESVTR